MKRFQQFFSGVSLLLLLALILIAGVAGAADFSIPDSLSVLRGETPCLGRHISLDIEEETPLGAHATRASATARLFGVLPLKEVEITTFEALSLCPGGDVFGIRVFLGGAMVTSLTKVTDDGGNEACPAREAGLLPGDLITAVGGKEIRDAAALSAAIAASEGRAITLTVLREGCSRTLRLVPRYSASAGAYRAGILVKDQAAGIGTMTFIDPRTGAFGGLGHGIYGAEAPVLLPVERGIVSDVKLSGVVPGTPGDPGELRGRLGEVKRGTLLSNTECGVFGVLGDTEGLHEPIPIGLSSSVHVGDAEILCTLRDGECRSYRIEITELRAPKADTKCFTIRVTDPALLSVTGGIVQGMSGSPIIQDGHLIGAVTHVMINDPTAGYGIFIENMLAAAEREARAA